MPHAVSDKYIPVCPLKSDTGLEYSYLAVSGLLIVRMHAGCDIQHEIDEILIYLFGRSTINYRSRIEVDP